MGKVLYAHMRRLRVIQRWRGISVDTYLGTKNDTIVSANNTSGYQAHQQKKNLTAGIR
jgi:hypothetical protein